jgi:ABC-type molybdate transport system permease subunit
VAVLVLALWLSPVIVGYSFFGSWEERGQFGDLFGSVNALFSGLAFAGLIYAILLQRQELTLQRAELKLQREEMTASRAELAA